MIVRPLTLVDDNIIVIDEGGSIRILVKESKGNFSEARIWFEDLLEFIIESAIDNYQSLLDEKKSRLEEYEKAKGLINREELEKLKENIISLGSLINKLKEANELFKNIKAKS